MKNTHIKKDEELLSGIIAGIRQREPILENPEGLTEDIMNAIRVDKKENPPGIIEKSGKSPVLTILLRLMAAASVCLFLIFGYEEYVVVDKISRLEMQNAAISHSSQYHTTLQLKKALSILASDPEMLDRYKEIKSRKMYFSTLSPLNAILKQFDSIYHTKQR